MTRTSKVVKQREQSSFSTVKIVKIVKIAAASNNVIESCLSVLKFQKFIIVFLIEKQLLNSLHTYLKASYHISYTHINHGRERVGNLVIKCKSTYSSEVRVSTLKVKVSRPTTRE